MEDAGVVLPAGSAGRPGSDGAAGGDGRSISMGGFDGGAAGPLKPGDPFACGNGSTTCIAGQSYCRLTNKGPQPEGSASCQPLCPAGDCTCFCESATGCDFAPADRDCQGDHCSCMTAFDSSGAPLPGGITVTCGYTTPGCYPAIGADQACSGASYAAYCTGANTVNPMSGCTPLPDNVIAPACLTTESHYYCCPA